MNKLSIVIVLLSTSLQSQTIVSFDFMKDFERLEIDSCIMSLINDSVSEVDSQCVDYSIVSYRTTYEEYGQLELRKSNQYYRTFLDSGEVSGYELISSKNGTTYCIRLLLNGNPIVQDIVMVRGESMDTTHNLVIFDDINNGTAFFTTSHEYKLSHISLALNSGILEMDFYPNGSPSECNLYSNGSCILSTSYYENGIPRFILEGEIRNSIRFQVGHGDTIGLDISSDFNNINDRLVQGRFIELNSAGSVLNVSAK